MPHTNVRSEWVDGNLVFFDKSGNEIATLDGTNRKLSIPSGSTLANAGTTTYSGTQTFDDIAGNDASLGITGLAATSDTGGAIVITGGATTTSGVGGLVSVTGGAGSGTSNGGAASLVGGASGSGATGVGGNVSVTAGAAASTNGNGGAAAVAGGAATGTGTGGAATVTGGLGGATNAVGGAATVTAGAGQGTGAGAVASLVGGASGAGATGNGGAANVTGGAAASTNGGGGSVVLTGGAKAGTGIAGGVMVRSNPFTVMAEPGAGTDQNETLTAAQMINGVYVHTVATGRTLTTPTGANISAGCPASLAVGDSFLFSVITVGTGADDISTLTAGDGNVTFVGNVTVGPDSATNNAYGTWRFRNSGTNTWVGYRIG